MKHDRSSRLARRPTGQTVNRSAGHAPIPSSAVWLGVDVGGTFTDLVAVDAAGHVATRKVLSTPADQSVGVEEALRALGQRAVERFVHGTTVATNMLLERKGARVAFCVTEGFADLLYLRRQNRISLYDLAADSPPPLALRDSTIEVPERVEPQGVTRPLTRAAADAVAGRVAALDPAPDVIAVLLLHSYRDPTHERLLRDALVQRMPGTDVVLSSDVFPEVREYERGATTVAEAYLRPGVATYLRRLRHRLTIRPTERPDRIGVMTSNGGMRSIDEAASSASLLALSGPAGGVVGAAAIARHLKIARALTIDIGGTSADVGLILDGAPLVEPGGMVADVPIASPRVLVETVSAGGGSVAWIDDGGALRVGPHSAGAVPGPAAFGRGGVRPTVTDAHVALGNIQDVRMSGGIALDVDAARDSITGLARKLNAPARRVAQAIVATADAAMARALRRVSVERGVDPRDCTLIAFGGGGPLHACGLAELLGMSRVIVPPHAGVLSALGLAMSPERRERMAGVTCRLDQWDDELRRDTLNGLARDFPRDLTTRHWFARARFVGQGHELDVPLSPATPAAQIAKSFARLHQQRYGFTLDAPIEIVSVRHVAERPGRAVRFARAAKRPRPIRGPHAMALHDATLLVKDGWRARSVAGDGWELTPR